MLAQVKTWGNGQGIRISKEAMQLAGITLDDTLDMQIEEGKIVFLKHSRHRSLEERAAEYGGILDVDAEWDIEPMGREIW